MQNENRVLLRRGARTLSGEEVSAVVGSGIHTETVCTFDLRVGYADGDTGECGAV